MKPPLFSILIVTWNNENDVGECIQSFLNSTYTNFNITVIDSASSDKTLEIVKEKFPMVKILPMPENKYYTGALNFGIGYIQETFAPKYILYLNADTVAEPDMLEELLNVAEDFGMGNANNLLAVGPKVKFFEQRNKIYSLGIDYDGFLNACQIGHGEIDKGQFDKSTTVFGIEGTCVLLVARNLKKFGPKPFWEKLKMYSEDVEFFIRARKFGLVAITAPKAVIYHKVMASTKQNLTFKVKEQKMHNWLLIALRHYKFKSKLAILKKYILWKFLFIREKL